MQAGELRHVVTLQRLVEVQDTSGQMESDYEDIEALVRAEIVPMSGREYVAGQQVQAEVTTRIKIRWRAGYDTAMRIVQRDDSVQPPALRVYDVQAMLPDPISGRKWINFMCVQRMSEGWRRGNIP